MASQTIIKDVGGTIETFFSTQRPATCTVSLYTDRGGAKVDAASATVDTVSTTVSSAVAAAATTVALADASGVISGRRYMLGLASSTEPLEVVTVRSLASSTATLVYPAVYAHSSGAAFRGGRVSYTVAAASTDVTWWDGYAVFTPATGDPQTEQVDSCLRKIPDTFPDISDVLQVFPKGKKMLDAELDLSRALRSARDQFLRDVGGKVRAQSYLGVDDFRYAAALRFWITRRPSMGEQSGLELDWLQKEYERELVKLMAQSPADAEQDGVTSGPFDGGMTSGIIERA